MNRRRTKQENVSVEFEDEQFGTTWGHFLASTDDYGADRLWVVLEPIPIELDALRTAMVPPARLPPVRVRDYRRGA